MEDRSVLRQLFVDTISASCRNEYDDAQINAWLSGADHPDFLLGMLENQHVIIAENREELIGFCSLAGHSYVDYLYVHKDYQKEGVAKALYLAVEKVASSLSTNELTADVSLTAVSFFENVGFRIKSEQKVVRLGIEIKNFSMVKSIKKEK